MVAITSRSPKIQRAFAVLVIAAAFLFTGCKSTYQYDKKRVVIFTFGLGLTFISDKEAELDAETKAQDKNGGANGR